MTHDERARLFRQLATMTRAGMPAAEAVGTLAGGEAGVTASLLTRASRAIQSGESIASALRRHDLVSEWEVSVLAASTEAGRLDEAFHGLAVECERRAAPARRLRTRLVFPAAVLVLALVITPVIGLAVGQYGVLGYLWRVLLPLAALWGLAWVIRKGWRRMVIAPGAATLSSLTLHLPFISGLVALRARSHLLHALVILLRSGVPAHQAMPLAVAAVANPLLRQRHRVATVRLENGATVTEALKAAGVLGSSEGHAMVAAGEHAGSLDDMLERQARSLDDELVNREELLAEWLPRIFYLGVLGYMALQVIGFYGAYFRSI